MARIYAKRTGATPDIEVKGFMARRVSVGQELPVEDFLNSTRKYVASVLGAFSDPPPDVLGRAAIPQPSAPEGGADCARHQGRNPEGVLASNFSGEDILTSSERPSARLDTAPSEGEGEIRHELKAPGEASILDEH